MRPRPGPHRRLAASATLVLAAIVPSALAPGVHAAPAATAHAVAGTLEWERCGRGVQCSELAVPVDHDAPDGEQVSVALVRAPARDRSRRIGSLVVNFGGPGDAGTETLPLTLDRFPDRIRDRFDIVSFDPRGTGGTRQIDCVDDATSDVLAAEDPTPDDLAELERFFTGAGTAVDVEAACIERYGDWLAAVGSRNVARDMDRIRAALGERRINYLGYSYGTVIGAVYAQEFPDRIRTMVLDGAVNLTSTPAEEQTGNAAGFEGALDEFLAWCADTTRCEFGGRDPRAALTRLHDRFEGGLVVPVGDGRNAGVAAFYLAMVASLYDRTDGWPALALALQDAARGNGSIMQFLADLYLGRDERGRYSAIQEAIVPIRCADERTPLVEYPEFRATYEELTAAYPFFGALVGSSQTGCDPRLPVPQPGDEVGDVRAAPDGPVLVIGTTGDPATPYDGALDLRSRIAGSRLLTFESTEHAAYGRGVACIDDAVDRYLIGRTPPREGTTCSA
jgi:pimeloyl-ACP methyl ester carboxylesterase